MKTFIAMAALAAAIFLIFQAQPEKSVQITQTHEAGRIELVSGPQNQPVSPDSTRAAIDTLLVTDSGQKLYIQAWYDRTLERIRLTLDYDIKSEKIETTKVLRKNEKPLQLFFEPGIAAGITKQSIELAVTLELFRVIRISPYTAVINDKLKNEIEFEAGIRAGLKFRLF